RESINERNRASRNRSETNRLANCELSIVNFMFQPYLAIVPLCCLTATAIAVMLAEAFRGPGERMPMAPLGAIGLTGAALASIALWNSDATSFGMVAADNFGLFVGGILVVIG